MFAAISDLYAEIAKWCNDNQGVLGVTLFLATLILGWASGIFSALRRRPKFKLRLIDGPTFCCTYKTGTIHKGFEVHRTGIALYLSIANVGSSAASIDGVSVGYHWFLRRSLSIDWLKNCVGWHWLTDQIISLSDFHVSIGDRTKVYPFLTQINFSSPAKSNTYLEVGQSTNGVVYFEQSDSWGGCFPSVKNGRVHIKVRVRDTFGNQHVAKFLVPSVSLEGARKYNPDFGKTHAELRGEPLPSDGDLSN